jgi:CTD small phosphatase-like protein 2
MPSNFQLQPENGIFIKSWVGDAKDTILKDMIPMLCGIFYIDYASKTPMDIRNALKAAKDGENKKKEEAFALLNLSV